jgi:hypothetical protein
MSFKGETIMKRKAFVGLILIMLFWASVFPLGIFCEVVTGYTQPSGLVGYWNFDQGSGTTAYDSSGNNNHGTIYGASWTSGKVNDALFFDGVNNYVDCGNGETLDPTREATIEAWVNFDILPSDAGHIMEIASRSGGGTDLDLQAETDNRIKFFVGPGTPNVAVSNTVVEIDKWYHVAATYQAGNNIKIYINGALEETTSISITRNSNSNNFSIGQSLYWPGRFFEGKIDEVKIYNRALSEEEIEAEYIQVSISPESKVMSVGQSQTFTSSISGGTSPYTYQWYLNGASVSGATSASWTFTAETSGSYTVYVSVSDEAGALETSNTAAVTVNSGIAPAPSATTSVTVSDNFATVDQSAKTGVSIVVSGSSLQDGTQLNVTSTNYGGNQPEDTGVAPLDAIAFYGFNVAPDVGALISDVFGDISISNPSFNSSSAMEYWNGVDWVSVATRFTAPDTVSGTIPASALAGTTILVGTPKSNTSTAPLSASLLIIIAVAVVIIIVLGVLFVYARKRKAK